MMPTAELDSAVWCTPGLGICTMVFLANCLFFANKWSNKDQMSDSLKKTRELLTFGERPEQITYAHSFLVSNLSLHRSFLTSNLSDSLKSLIKKLKNVYKTYQKYNFNQIFWANHSFAHLSWVNKANRSQSLIFHEWPERFAHGCSFDMSDLIDLLTVAHLSWAISANCLQLLIWFKRSEQMS